MNFQHCLFTIFSWKHFPGWVGRSKKCDENFFWIVLKKIFLERFFIVTKFLHGANGLPYRCVLWKKLRNVNHKNILQDGAERCRPVSLSAVCLDTFFAWKTPASSSCVKRQWSARGETQNILHCFEKLVSELSKEHYILGLGFHPKFIELVKQITWKGKKTQNRCKSITINDTSCLHASAVGGPRDSYGPQSQVRKHCFSVTLRYPAYKIHLMDISFFFYLRRTINTAWWDYVTALTEVQIYTRFFQCTYNLKEKFLSGRPISFPEKSKIAHHDRQVKLLERHFPTPQTASNRHETTLLCTQIFFRNCHVKDINHDPSFLEMSLLDN